MRKEIDFSARAQRNDLGAPLRRQRCAGTAGHAAPRHSFRSIRGRDQLNNALASGSIAYFAPLLPATLEIQPFTLSCENVQTHAFFLAYDRTQARARRYEHAWPPTLTATRLWERDVMDMMVLCRCGQPSGLHDERGCRAGAYRPCECLRDAHAAYVRRLTRPARRSGKPRAAGGARASQVALRYGGATAWAAADAVDDRTDDAAGAERWR